MKIVFGKVYILVAAILFIQLGFSEPLKIAEEFRNSKIGRSIVPKILDRSYKETSYPYIDHEVFISLADHIIDTFDNTFDPSKVKNGDIIFIDQRREFFQDFFERAHPLINAKYILISHTGCFHANSRNRLDNFEKSLFDQIIEDEKIAVWFCRSPEFENEKIRFLPLGLPQTWTNRVTKNQVDRSLEGGKTIKDNYFREKKFLCSVTFNKRSYREEVFSQIKPLRFLDFFKRLRPDKYFETLLSSQFSISPNGYGLQDCFRHWECLLAGAIPIVNTKEIMYAFKDLPVIYVDDYSKITKSFLVRARREILGKIHTYNFDKLYADYWIKDIKKIQEQLRQL